MLPNRMRECKQPWQCGLEQRIFLWQKDSEEIVPQFVKHLANTQAAKAQKLAKQSIQSVARCWKTLFSIHTLTVVPPLWAGAFPEGFPD